MMTCGLLGRKLSHSYSPQIHAKLQDYDYRLFEVEPDSLADFLKNGAWDALNVTIPYKKDVLPFCAELSDTVCAVGSANTLVKRADGSIFADNTDAYGFAYLLQQNGVDVSGKKVLVLGSGGASVTVCHVLRQHNARQVVVISRSGENNYGNLLKHADAEILVNTTPVGMYPDVLKSPVQVADFPRCEAVLDIIYNPARTALLLQAEALGLSYANGLSMLVAQAKRSSELFTGTSLSDERIPEIKKQLEKQMQNIILIGMPGCGKSTVGRLLAEQTGRPFFDADAEIVQKTGMPIPEFFAKNGEAAFRDAESAVLQELGKQSGCVIATGGGAVLREENYGALHQNGVIVYLQRALSLLPKDNRPISQKNDLAALFAVRKPHYERFADFTFENAKRPEDVCHAIREAIL